MTELNSFIVSEPHDGHFSGNINRGSGSYHGPAVCDHETLNNIFSTKDPHYISKVLCEIASKDTEFKSFNHRNAWSFEQLKSLATKHGFEFIKCSQEALNHEFSDLIPDWYDMNEWSLYACFSKADN